MTENKMLPVVLLCILLISTGCVEQETDLDSLENTTNDSKNNVSFKVYNNTVENLGYRNYFNNSSGLSNQSLFNIGIYEKNINTTANISEYSVRDIIYHYNLTVSKYANETRIAEEDPTLTEDSIDELINESDDIKLIDIIEGSSVKLKDIISKNNLVEDINKSNNSDINFSLYSYTKSSKIEIFGSDYTFTDGLESNPSLVPYFSSERLNMSKDKKITEDSYKLDNKTYNYTIYSIYIYNNTYSKRARLIESKVEYDDFIVEKTGIYPISSQKERENIIKLMKETKRIDK